MNVRDKWTNDVTVLKYAPHRVALSTFIYAIIVDNNHFDMEMVRKKLILEFKRCKAVDIDGLSV